MARSRRDGVLLLFVGLAVFLLFGCALRLTAKDSMADFRSLYSASRALMSHHDPYSKSDLNAFYEQNLGSLGSIRNQPSAMLYVNLPFTLVLVAPLALVPYKLAAALWMALTAASLTLASILAWKLAAHYAPGLSGALIALAIVNGAIVLGNGNPAGIVTGLCVIAVWCFLERRYETAGVICLGVSMALKPHDVGLIWLCLVLFGGVWRKRALQTLGVTILLSGLSVVWVAQAAPGWLPELRSNLAEISAPGANNDPGPAGLTSRTRTPETIVSLQAAASTFSQDSRTYDPVSDILCGAALLGWLLITLRAERSREALFLALASVAPLALLITYHRAYDARILLLTIPACALLWARSAPERGLGVLITLTGLCLTGEVPLAIFFAITKKIPIATAGIGDELRTLVVLHPAVLALLAMEVFYLLLYAREAHRPRAAAAQSPQG
jgi:hypothetical protein